MIDEWAGFTPEQRAKVIFDAIAEHLGVPPEQFTEYLVRPFVVELERHIRELRGRIDVQEAVCRELIRRLPQ